MRIGAISGADFAANLTDNLMVTFDGRVTLGSRNRAPNPDFKDLTSAGDVDEWTLGAPMGYDGYNVYLRRLTSLSNGVHTPLRGTIPTRQNSSPLPFDRPSYTQTDPLVSGAPLPDAGTTAPIAPPPAPIADTVDMAQTGYAAGVYAIAYAGVSAGKKTAASRRVYVTLAQGQSAKVFLPASATAGWDALALYMSEVRADEASASTSPLRLQRVIDIRGGVAPSYTLGGPYRKDEVALGANQTYVGGYETLAAPVWWISQANATLRALSTDLSYSIRTKYGWTASQRMSRVNVPRDMPSRSIWFRLPGYPPGTLAWRPEYRGLDGAWYTLGGDISAEVGFSPQTVVGIFSLDPNQTAANSALKHVQVQRRMIDESGTPSPDGALDAPAPVSGTTNPPGNYEVRLTRTSGEKESAPSPPTVVTLPESAPGSGVTSRALRVFNDQNHNLIQNPQSTELSPTTGKATVWIETPQAGITQTIVDKGVVEIDNTSGSSTTAVVRSQSNIRINQQSIVIQSEGARAASVVNVSSVIRAQMEMVRYVSGIAQVVLRQVNAQNAVLSSHVIGQISGPGKIEIHQSIGVGADDDIAAHPDLRSIILDFVATGNAQNFTARLTNWIARLGKAAPAIRPKRPAPPLPPPPSPPPPPPPSSPPVAPPPADPPPVLPPDNSEPPAEAYPTIAYCTPVTGVDELLPVELRGLGVSMIEYYAFPGTPPYTTYGPRGMKAPLKPGSTYCLSIYESHRGVTQVTDAMKSVVRDARGRPILENPPLIPALSGRSNGWNRPSISFTVPPDGAYLEVTTANLSDGQVRLAAPQLEFGTSPSAYTNQNALSGVLLVDSDTRILESDSNMPHGYLNRVQTWLRDRIVVTLQPNTTVSTQWYSSDDAVVWDGPYADFGLLPKRTYIRARTTLTTLDATLSPEISEVGMEVARPMPVLLREDGSEFAGGCEVLNLPAAREVPAMKSDLMADNTIRRREFGIPAREFSSLSLRCWLDGTASEVQKMQQGKGVFLIESRGRRYRVRLREVNFKADRATYTPRVDGDALGWYMHTADTAADIEGEDTPL